MTSSAATLRGFAFPARLVASWNAASTRWNPLATIVVAWATLTWPLIFFRGSFGDEGHAVVLARSALDDGAWLVPYRFTLRFIERPVLLSWIIAAVSEPFGAVNQITARSVVAAFLLFGCVLIYWLLRRVSASVPAALLGVAMFLACPLVIRSYVLITADMPLAVTLLFGFALWWDAYAKGPIGFGRWLAIGVVLTLAGLFKGPQPVAYFVLGIGLFVLGTRSWRQIPGLIFAGLICATSLGLWYWAVYAAPTDAQLWGAFMRVHPWAQFLGPLAAIVRLFADTLPATLLAAAFLLTYRFREYKLVNPKFIAALACYAFVAAVVILFWPGGSTPRFYFPMLLPLAVFGGLGYDALSVRRPEIVTPVMLLTAGLLVYALIYAAASPFLPMRFRQAQIDAARVTAVVDTAPAPIYEQDNVALNVVAYVPGKIFDVTLDEMETARGPAWMLLTAPDADTLLAHHPGSLHLVIRLGEADQWRLLRLDP
jgi:4-amino-4-deoxy-L-arabinose transferase-like glycosyltransferase